MTIKNKNRYKMIITFFLFFIGILTLFGWYISGTYITGSELSGPLKLLAWALLIVLLAMIPVSFFLKFKGLTGNHIIFLSNAAYTSMGFFSLLVFGLIFKDSITYAVKGIFQLKSTIQTSENSIPITTDRRKFLFTMLNSGLLLLAGTSTLYGMKNAGKKPGIVRSTIEIKNLPHGLEGFRIVQISDLHIENRTDKDFLSDIVRSVNALKPDLIAITGDLIDALPHTIKDSITPLKNLKSTHGSYFVTGNHEYYFDAPGWVEEIKDQNVTVLLNNHNVIRHNNAELVVAGVTDLTAGDFLKSHASDPKRAIEGAPENALKLLLAHQPRSINGANKGSYDIQLSGHTHGGQYFPATKLIHMFEPYVKGSYDVDGTHLYVNCGTGTWGPQIRIGSSTEITLHTFMNG